MPKKKNPKENILAEAFSSQTAAAECQFLSKSTSETIHVPLLIEYKSTCALLPEFREALLKSIFSPLAEKQGLLII